VICEKLNLSPEVAQPESAIFTAQYAGEGQTHGGQCKALAEGNSQRPLTPEQAKALAEISILGHTDLSYNNAYFTIDGRFALLDTEPHKRAVKKLICPKSLLGYWIGSKDALVAQQAIIGIAKLKTYCSNEAAHREIEKVEKTHVIWNSAIIVAKIALLSFAYYLIPSGMALLPINRTAASLIQVSLRVLSGVKLIYLALNVTGLCMTWRKSQRHLEGLMEIIALESAGFI
jgi:hypothetical protein